MNESSSRQGRRGGGDRLCRSRAAPPAGAAPGRRISASPWGRADRRRGACRRWRRSWDAQVEPFDVDALGSDTDAVFLAVPEALAAEVAPALAGAGHAGVRSVGRLPAARPGVPAALVPAFAGGRRPAHLRADRALPRAAAGRASSSPAPAAIRPRRCWRCSRWSRPACSSRGSSSTPSRASPAPARRRPSARTSPSATAASRPTACSRTATPRRSSRSSACR